MIDRTTLYGGPDFAPQFPDGQFRARMYAPILAPGRPLPPIRNSGFISSASDRFSVPGDYQTFCAIAADMRYRAGAYEPIAHWHIDNAGENKDDIRNVEDASTRISYEIAPEEFDAKYGSLERMLDPFLGRNGMQPPTANDIRAYEAFLRAVDHLGIVDADLHRQSKEGGYRLSDLGSLLDANFALGYTILRDPAKIRILEIGGGYGRLAEALVNILQGNCHYVMADSVPAALMFADAYLRRALPHYRIGSYYRGDTYSEDFHVYIMPSWSLPALPGAFDVGVNIESFQEMSASHVDLYLADFTRRILVGGTLLISNSWSYLYKGGFRISSEFKTVYLQNTPRSWTSIHPTHVLQRGAADFTDNNNAMIDFFRMTCG